MSGFIPFQPKPGGLDAEEPPLRVFFGTAPIGIAKADYASRIDTWEKWNDVSVLAQG